MIMSVDSMINDGIDGVIMFNNKWKFWNAVISSILELERSKTLNIGNVVFILDIFNFRYNYQ